MSFPRTAGPHWLFDTYDSLGFAVGDDPDERVQFAFARSSGPPNDWQPTYDRVADRIPGSNRTLRQNMGAGPLTLATDVLFRDAYAYQHFLTLRTQPGTLTMNRAYTMYPGAREFQINQVVYVEFDDVYVAADPSNVRRDTNGVVHCRIVFEREDTTA